jgi:hypothetical protein
MWRAVQHAGPEARKIKKQPPKKKRATSKEKLRVHTARKLSAARKRR